MYAPPVPNDPPEGSGDFELALRGLLQDLKDGRDHSSILRRWDSARGRDWYVGTLNKSGYLLPKQVVDRYDAMLLPFGPADLGHTGREPRHLRWMLEQLRLPMPVGKANRWLGFIQAGVIALGLTTVQAERDFTRPFFKDSAHG